MRSSFTVFCKLGCITDQDGWKSELTKQYLVTAPHTAFQPRLQNCLSNMVHGKVHLFPYVTKALSWITMAKMRNAQELLVEVSKVKLQQNLWNKRGWF